MSLNESLRWGILLKNLCNENFDSEKAVWGECSHESVFYKRLFIYIVSAGFLIVVLSADLTSRGSFIRNDEVVSCIRATIFTFLLALLGLAKLIISNARENDKTGSNIVQFLSITEPCGLQSLIYPAFYMIALQSFFTAFILLSSNLTFTSYSNWPHILVDIRTILGYSKIGITKSDELPGSK